MPVSGQAMRNVSIHIAIAVGLVFRAPRYRLLALGLFALVLAVNLFTLPATYTGGVVGLISLRYLTVELGIFAVTLAVLFSLVLTLDVYAFRAAIRQRDKSLSLVPGRLWIFSTAKKGRIRGRHIFNVSTRNVICRRIFQHSPSPCQPGCWILW